MGRGGWFEIGIGCPGSRGWKNFGMGVGGLENWTIFMEVICLSSLIYFPDYGVINFKIMRGQKFEYLKNGRSSES